MRDRYTRADRAHRERLEKSASVGARADITAILNSAPDSAIQRSVVTVLNGLRDAAQGRRRIVADMNARHDKLAASGAFDRLHPESGLRRRSSVPTDPEFFEGGPSGSKPFRPGDDVSPQTTGARDARNEFYTPKLQAKPVTDSGGAFHGGESTLDGKDSSSDHWSDERLHDALDFLSAEDLKHLMSMRWRSRFY